MTAASTAATVVSILTDKKKRGILTTILTIPLALVCVLMAMLFYQTDDPNDVYLKAVTKLSEEEHVEGSIDGNLVRSIHLLASGTVSESVAEIMEYLQSYFLVEDEKKVEHTVTVTGVGEDGKPFQREETEIVTRPFIRFVESGELLSRLTESPFSFEDFQIEIVKLYLNEFGDSGSSGKPEEGGASFTGQFIMPCSGYVSSPWGYREDPFGGTATEKHTGVDLCGKWHQPIHAIADGVVHQVNTRIGSYGNYVMIRHDVAGRSFYSFYAHMSLVKVSQGMKVTQGMVIGLEGGEPGVDNNHGDSTGHHLHFEIRLTPQRNSNVDPAGYLNGLF